MATFNPAGVLIPIPAEDFHDSTWQGRHALSVRIQGVAEDEFGTTKVNVEALTSVEGDGQFEDLSRYVFVRVWPMHPRIDIDHDIMKAQHALADLRVRV